MHKVFIYLTRSLQDEHRLLVLESHDEPGYEVPKGGVEPRESLIQAMRRELLEEAGIAEVQVQAMLGMTPWQHEQQHFIWVEVLQDLPRQFDHVVSGDGEDRGFVYRFSWLPLNAELSAELVQGCARFVPELLTTIQSQRPHP